MATPRSTRRRGRSSTFAFTVRLSLAIAATFALLGIAGYLMMGDQLQRRLLDTYAAEHRAHAATFLGAELRARTDFEAHGRIRELLGGIARRLSVTEALLVSPDGVVEASSDAAALCRRDVDVR